MRTSPVARFCVLSVALLVVADNSSTAGQGHDRQARKPIEKHFSKMSTKGRLAYLLAKGRAKLPSQRCAASVQLNARAAGVDRDNLAGKTDSGLGGKLDLCMQADEDCGREGFSEGPYGTQSEQTIAVGPTGQHVVIRFNDFRGASLNPISSSGCEYTDGCAATFQDGGHPPLTSNGQLANGTKLPQV